MFLLLWKENLGVYFHGPLQLHFGWIKYWIHVLRGGGFCTPLADSKFKYELLLSHEQGKKKAVSPCGIPEDEVCEKRLKQKSLDSELFLFYQLLGHHVTIIYESDRNIYSSEQ